MSKFQFRHVMIRVKDLERSIEFYTKILGMELIRRSDFPDGKFTLAFLGYGPEDTNTVIELTHNWERAEPYAVGDGFGHLALGVRDIHGICKEIEAAGAEIPRQPGPMKHGTTVIAFIKDPDGYLVELIDLDSK